ncbi:MAG: hypothetical protein JWN02_2010 [Acidobacteria bacterium]|nr:hypothetical protein [Acidobacteriota bacterium]
MQKTACDLLHAAAQLNDTDQNEALSQVTQSCPPKILNVSQLFVKRRLPIAIPDPEWTSPSSRNGRQRRPSGNHHHSPKCRDADVRHAS